MDSYRKRAESFAKYHEEHAKFGGASCEFHELACSFLRSIVEETDIVTIWRNTVQEICDELDPFKPIASPVLAVHLVRALKAANVELRAENAEWRGQHENALACWKADNDALLAKIQILEQKITGYVEKNETLKPNF